MADDKVTLKFDGDDQEYHLEFDFNHVADAEPVSQSNLLAAMTRPREMTAAQLRGLTYAALKKRHPAVTLGEAGWLISQHTAMVSDAVAMVYGFMVVEEPAAAAAGATEVVDAAKV